MISPQVWMITARRENRRNGLVYTTCWISARQPNAKLNLVPDSWLELIEFYWTLLCSRFSERSFTCFRHSIVINAIYEAVYADFSTRSATVCFENIFVVQRSVIAHCFAVCRACLLTTFWDEQFSGRRFLVLFLTLSASQNIINDERQTGITGKDEVKLNPKTSNQFNSNVTRKWWELRDSWSRDVFKDVFALQNQTS